MGDAGGRTRPGPSAELGIPAGTPVIAGGNDALASFHGAGLVDAGDAVDTGGTSGGLGVYWDRELDIPGTYRAPAGLPGLWLYGGAMNAIGKSVDWVVALLLGRCRCRPRTTCCAKRRDVPPGAAGLVFLPYLAGERAPIDDDRARGVFAGLSLAHGRGHLVRAVLEAGAFALRHVAEPIRGARASVSSGWWCPGRPTASCPWPRCAPTSWACPVDVPAVPDTAALGAAHPGGRGHGRLPGRRQRHPRDGPHRRRAWSRAGALAGAL